MRVRRQCFENVDSLSLAIWRVVNKKEALRPHCRNPPVKQPRIIPSFESRALDRERGVSVYWCSKSRLTIDWRAGFNAECLLAVLLMWGGVGNWGGEVAAEGEVEVDAVLQALVSEGDHCVAGVDGSALGFEDLDDGHQAF